MDNGLLQIEQEILECIQTQSSDLRNPVRTDGEWTMPVKKALHELARKRFGVWGSHEESDGPEWLWDLCWARYDHVWMEEEWYKTFTGIYLACEIEWNRSEIEQVDDFLKLTVADVDLRLFIFAASDVNKAELRIELLYRLCPPSKGFRYMAIGIPDKMPDGGTLPHKAWIV